MLGSNALLITDEIENRKPVPVTPWQPQTPDERRRYAAAEVRKQMRREQEQRFLALRVTS